MNSPHTVEGSGRYARWLGAGVRVCADGAGGVRVTAEVGSLMRRVSCLRAEALRLCGALQEAGGVGAEGAWRELHAAAARRLHLDALLQLHARALDKHAVHAMIHHTTQV